MYIKNFAELFTDNAAVYNDIITELYSGELLTIDEYSTGVPEKFPSGITITIENKEYGDMKRYSGEGTGTIEVKAVKEVLGMTVDDEFYEETFDIVFILSFNLDLSNFKIIGSRMPEIENK